MFTPEQIEMLDQFITVDRSLDNVSLYMSSKITDNKWLTIDFGEKFKERYGIYFKGIKDEGYRLFNNVEGIPNILALISSYETKKKN